MYAKGMTTRDIGTHMQDIYGIEVSAGMISQITDKVMPLVEEWHARPLANTYVVMYLDGIFFKVRDGGRIVSKCAYTCLGITPQGAREVMGIWISGSEGARFWLEVLNDMKSRGVEDIIIACVDGLKGFSEAIHAVFPQTDIQQCIVHQIRNTMKYVPHKDREEYCKDLRSIYTAPTESAGYDALQAAKEKWPHYQTYLKSWEDKWPKLSTFFAYPHAIRRMIYTTNAVENLHRQMRKVTKTTTIFPHEDSLRKLLWLAQNDIGKRWGNAMPGWYEIVTQLAILHPDRLKLS